MEPTRPNPDTLLKKISGKSGNAGKLKIYLGMSAGVGKTYAMLSDALIAKARGTDIVSGYIEPHGRAETEALAERIERLPTRLARHRDLNVQEFDLEAALARKPQTILVDELAHTNPPDSQHLKRWQDVEALLADGIDVWTTVNVQHIESLKDVVGKITGIEVQETVPDVFIARAEDVELVDIPPEELIQRVREGKVYRPENVERSLQNFFRKGNLIALRELVLRHMAERVDAQLRSYRDEHAVKEVWPAAERVLVCVAPNALSTRVVRAAGRLAQTLHAKLIALSVEGSQYSSLSESQRQHAGEALRVAENLGGRIVVKSSDEIVSTILEVVREENITSLVVGKPTHSRWKDLLFGSVVDELTRRSGDVMLHVIPATKSAPVEYGSKAPRIDLTVRGAGVALAVTALGTVVGELMSPYFALSNINMIYLLGILWVATRYSRTDAVLTVVFSVLAFDFFFVPPQFTFSVSDVEYLVTFVVMLVVGVLMSSLTARLKAQNRIVSDREQRTSALYSLTQKLLSAGTSSELGEVVVDRVGDLLHADGVLLIPSGNSVVPASASRTSFEQEQNEIAVARWVYDRKARAGVGTDTLAGAAGHYVPLMAGQNCLGVLGVTPTSAKFGRHDQELLLSLADQVSLALERLRLEEESHSAKLTVEKERLRNAFLSSVSHDLKTPLASITGAASVLSQANSLPESGRQELALTIAAAAERLERVLRNVLDITRLEEGAVQLRTEWFPLDELVGTALRRVQSLLGTRDIHVQIPHDIPLVAVDGVLFEQLLVNILENATRYTPPGSAIEVSAAVDGKYVRIVISDNGPGIPPGTEEKVFEKLYRAGPRDQQGFGLGLTICRAIASAHGGKIWVENRPGGGASFTVELPLREDAPEVPHE